MRLLHLFKITILSVLIHQSIYATINDKLDEDPKLPKYCSEQNPKFEICDLDSHDLQSLIENKMWDKDALYSHSRLKILKLSYYNFDGEPQFNGEMMVLDIIAPYIINIFKGLFNIKFPIASIKLVNDFQGNDQLATEANNSSCYYLDTTENPRKLTTHGYGLAIDLNPVQNPFQITDLDKGTISYIPKAGVRYRRNNQWTDTRDVITEKVVEIFKKNGFTIWGGDYTDESISYMHFQVSNAMSQLIYVVSENLDEEGAHKGDELFEQHVSYYNKNNCELADAFFTKFYPTTPRENLMKSMEIGFKKDPTSFFINIKSLHE